MAGRKKNILIVDDEANIRSSLNRLLLLQGNYIVNEADSVKSAEDIVKDSLPDLVLVDVGMPGKKGYELCLEIKDNPLMRDVKVIGMSGYAGGIGDAFMHACGADWFFEKPFDTQKMLKKIKELLKD